MNAAKQRQQSWDLGTKLLPTHLNTGDLQKLFGVSQGYVLKWHDLQISKQTS